MSRVVFPGEDTRTPQEKFRNRIHEIVSEIELGMKCTLRIGADDSRFFLQIECERIDTITKEMGIGRGGKAYLSPHMTNSEIIQIAFGLYKGYWEHEARETFIWRERRPFGPHIDTQALWEVARRVDVRSAHHVEDQDPPKPMSAPEKAKALAAGEELRDGYGKSLTKNTRDEWINEGGDTPCPNDGEMTSRKCWKCGWVRYPSVHPDALTEFDLSNGGK